MKVGDLVEAHSGERGVIIAAEKMYPDHPQSPMGRIAVEWVSEPPRWWRSDLMLSTFAVKVISNAP